jgi:hypothetical protein
MNKIKTIMYERRSHDKATAEHTISFTRDAVGALRFVFRPLGYNVVLFGICSPTFRKNILPPSLLSKSVAGYFLGILFDPEIEAVRSSETSANLYRTIRHHIPEDCTFHGFN